jgi:hypothetical protein
MFTNGWNNSKEGEIMVFMALILGCMRLQHVLRLGSGKISFSGTTKEPKPIKLHLKLAPDLQKTCAKQLKAKKQFVFIQSGKL